MSIVELFGRHREARMSRGSGREFPFDSMEISALPGKPGEGKR